MRKPGKAMDAWHADATEPTEERPSKQLSIEMDHDYAAMTDDQVRLAWRAAVEHEQRLTRGDRLLACVRVARDQPMLHREYRLRLNTPHKQEG
jgi:hypothetical protein